MEIKCIFSSEDPNLGGAGAGHPDIRWEDIRLTNRAKKEGSLSATDKEKILDAFSKHNIDPSKVRVNVRKKDKTIVFMDDTAEIGDLVHGLKTQDIQFYRVTYTDKDMKCIADWLAGQEIKKVAWFEAEEATLSFCNGMSGIRIHAEDAEKYLAWNVKIRDIDPKIGAARFMEKVGQACSGSLATLTKAGRDRAKEILEQEFDCLCGKEYMQPKDWMQELLDDPFLYGMLDQDQKALLGLILDPSAKEMRFSDAGNAVLKMECCSIGSSYDMKCKKAALATDVEKRIRSLESLHSSCAGYKLAYSQLEKKLKAGSITGYAAQKGKLYVSIKLEHQDGLILHYMYPDRPGVDAVHWAKEKADETRQYQKVLDSLKEKLGNRKLSVKLQGGTLQCNVGGLHLYRMDKGDASSRTGTGRTGTCGTGDIAMSYTPSKDGTATVYLRHLSSSMKKYLKALDGLKTMFPDADLTVRIDDKKGMKIKAPRYSPLCDMGWIAYVPAEDGGPTAWANGIAKKAREKDREKKKKIERAKEEHNRKILRKAEDSGLRGDITAIAILHVVLANRFNTDNLIVKDLRGLSINVHSSHESSAFSGKLNIMDNDDILEGIRALRSAGAIEIYYDTWDYGDMTVVKRNNDTDAFLKGLMMEKKSPSLERATEVEVAAKLEAGFTPKNEKEAMAYVEYLIGHPAIYGVHEKAVTRFTGMLSEDVRYYISSLAGIEKGRRRKQMLKAMSQPA